MKKEDKVEFEANMSRLTENLDEANEKASRLVSLLREAETIISSLSNGFAEELLKGLTEPYTKSAI